MSIFSSIRMANNALQAQQIGLQVVGQNISNVNTPGYVREEVVLETAPAQKVGHLVLGLGVKVSAVVQKIDQFLESRLRNAGSDASRSDVRRQTYLNIENLIGELGDSDLSSSLNNFFSSISEVLNQPESSTIRNLAVLQGGTLAGDIRRLSEQVNVARDEVNDRIVAAAGDINRLTEEIYTLNRKIAIFEAGNLSKSDAVGLRDQRGNALSELAELVDIKITHNDSGGVTVLIGGDFIVNEVARREVNVVTTVDRGQAVAEIQFTEIQSPPSSSSGRVAGLVESRDEILGGFLDQLDNFAATLAFEFNRIHSSGQGLTGYQTLESEFTVDDVGEPLDAAGLEFTPENGSFQILVRNRDTNITQTTDILVDLNGLDADSSLTSIVAAINAIDGLSASTTSTLGITIQSDSPDVEFSFANDTSGLLAALGLNTFFSGSTARDIDIRDELIADSRLFAASSEGIGEDTNSAVLMAGFIERPLESANNDSLDQIYKRITGTITQATSVARSVADGDEAFRQSLEAQRFSISGVSLDEEIVRMISYQRAYQATARYISELNKLMDILVNL